MKVMMIHGVNTNEDANPYGPWETAITNGLRAAGYQGPIDDTASVYGVNYNDIFDNHSSNPVLYAVALAELLASAAWHTVTGPEAAAVAAPQPGPGFLSDIRWSAGMVAQWVVEAGLRADCSDRLVQQIEALQPDVIIAHSLGTLLCYDLLVNDPRGRTLLTNTVLVTFGSQIGNPFVKDRMWGGQVEMPGVKAWYNLFNPYDPIFVASISVAATTFHQFTISPPFGGQFFDVSAHEATTAGPGQHPGYLDNATTDANLWPMLAGGSMARMIALNMRIQKRMPTGPLTPMQLSVFNASVGRVATAVPSASAARRFPAKGTPIASVPELEAHHQKLKSLGYHSVEEFVGAARASGDALGKYLGVDIDAMVVGLANRHTGMLEAADRHVRTHRKHGLGVALERMPRRIARAAFALPPAMDVPLPPSVNLISQMPPIKDQGERGSCVAFATLAAIEQYTGTQNAYVDLSEQFLYWLCKQRDGYPNDEGTYLRISFPGMNSDGSCLATTWPYNPSQIPGNESQDPPPGNAATEAAQYKIGAFQELAATSVLDLKKALARGRCVAFDIPVFNSWYQNVQVEATGDLVMPIPGEQNVGGHAMCLVGYVDDPTVPGGGAFILRNSWGTIWATQSTYTPGYGTIPYGYIAAYAEEAYCMA